LKPVLKKSVAHVAPVVMTVAVPVPALIVLPLAVRVAPQWVVTLRQQMVATSQLRPSVPMLTNPPFSASAR
jgi:hypothetical protein